MTAIGKFNIAPFGNGKSHISWSEGSGTRPYVIVEDLEGIIADAIIPHIEALRRLCMLFDQDSIKMLDDEIGSKVIAHLPDSHLIPGEQFEEEELRRWHHEQLARGYENAFGVRVYIP